MVEEREADIHEVGLVRRLKFLGLRWNLGGEEREYEMKEEVDGIAASVNVNNIIPALLPLFLLLLLHL